MLQQVHASIMYFPAHLLTRSFTFNGNEAVARLYAFNGNDVGARRKKRARK